MVDDSKKPDMKIKLIPMTSISLDALMEIRERLGTIQTRLAKLERTIEERIPNKILTEDMFKQELQSTEEIVDTIVSKLSNTIEPFGQSEIQPLEQLDQENNLTIVETKRIERIKSFLHRHNQLTSTQLAQLMNLSRTRCNEYFKQMEGLGMVEPILVGKEKFYRLS